jgi:hypothetical protein
MEGIEVNLDTNIGKWLSKVADTITRLAVTQNNDQAKISSKKILIYKKTKFRITNHIKISSQARLIQTRSLKICDKSLNSASKLKKILLQIKLSTKLKITFDY